MDCFVASLLAMTVLSWTVIAMPGNDGLSGGKRTDYLRVGGAAWMVGAAAASSSVRSPVRGG
jgi:hypothetical protein